MNNLGGLKMQDLKILLFQRPLPPKKNVLCIRHGWLLEGKYSLESTDPRESEIRVPPQPPPYLMPIPPTLFFITNSTYC